MQKILHIMASPSGAVSHSLKLSDALLERIGEGAILRRDLNKDAPPMVSIAYIGAVYSDPGQRTPEQRALLRYSDTVIAEVRDADVIVIATPVHNMGVPALLKAWIDQLVRPGATCGYGGTPIDGKKVYIAVASGRPSNPDFAGAYLKAILAEAGLTDVTVITVRGTAVRPIYREDYHYAIDNI